MIINTKKLKISLARWSLSIKINLKSYHIVSISSVGEIEFAIYLKYLKALLKYYKKYSHHVLQVFS